MVGLEATAEHVMNLNLVGKGRICEARCLFTGAKVLVFITEMGGDTTYFDIEAINLLTGTEKFEVGVHGKAACRCCRV